MIQVCISGLRVQVCGNQLVGDCTVFKKNVNSFLQRISKRKYFLPIAVLAGIGILVLVVMLLQPRGAGADLKYATVVRGSLTQSAEASGWVRAEQSAELTWKTSGIIEDVLVSSGEHVEAGQALSILERDSLPTGVILAQANLVTAERALNELKTSRLQQAQAMKTLEEARQAWEDAQNPVVAQANAQNAVAVAQKELEEAERLLIITASTPSEAAISQANANLLLAENAYNRTLKDIERIQKRLSKPESAYLFFESRELYQRILDSLEQKEIRDRRAYEKSQERYNQLLEPVDPLNLAVAEANVIGAQATVDDAQRKWERIRDGYTPGELAVLEAQLKDAEREWERLKDGPDEGDLLAAEARVAATQAVLNQVEIKAPFSGIISRLDARPGDQVSPGSLAFRLDDLSHLYVDVMVSEIDINRLKPGQKAVLTFDSIPARSLESGAGQGGAGTAALAEYTGSVVEISRVGTQVDGAIHYQVVIEIDQPDALIRPGVSADATIQVKEYQDVVQIPNRAVRYVDDRRIVFVADLGLPQPADVNLVTLTGEYSLLIDGELKPGDRIVLDPPEWLVAALKP